MDKIRVLLVEDEETLSMIVKDTLEDEGFEVYIGKDGEEGLRLFYEIRPHVLIADVMMPKLDGFEMVKAIRKNDQVTPILFLTARSALQDLLEGFELGGNDYLKKPFNLKELIVRTRALVSRVHSSNTEAIELFAIGEYSFNSTTQVLTYLDVSEELSHRESEILKRLCLNINGVVKTQRILLELWGDDDFFCTKSLHVFISKLRSRLAKDKGVKILNVRGVGYKLIV